MGYFDYGSMILGPSFAIACIVYAVVNRVTRSCHYKLPPGDSMPVDQVLQQHLWEHKEKFGPVSQLRILGFELYVLNTIDSIRHFLLSPSVENFTASREDTNVSQMVANDGMTARSDGIKCRRLRALISDTFKPYGSKAIEEAVIKEMTVLKDSLRKAAGHEIDLLDFITPSVSNVIFVMLIGKRFDYNHKIHNSFTCMTHELSILTDVKTNFVLSVFPSLQYLPFGYGKVYRKWNQAVEDVMKYLLYDVRAELEGEDAPEENNGFVYDLLKKQEQNKWLTDNDIHGVIRDFLIGSNITTRTVLYSLFLFMLHTPDIQPKVHEELEHITGDPTLDDQDKLPFTQAIIHEALRLASVTPMSVPRVVTQDIKLYGYDIPRDAIVLCNLWKVHHDDTLWTDPWEFVPERFIDDHDGTLLPSNHPVRRNLIPFGLGRRSCIGGHVAMATMFLFVSHLCQAFRFYRNDPDNLPSMDPSTFIPGNLNKPHNYKLRITVRSVLNVFLKR